MSYILSIIFRNILLYSSGVKNTVAYSKKTQFKACTKASLSLIPSEYNQWDEEYESW